MTKCSGNNICFGNKLKNNICLKGGVWAVVGSPWETTLTALNVTRRERGCRCFSRERNTAKSNEMKTRWRPTLEATHVTRRLPPTISNVGHVTARQYWFKGGRLGGRRRTSTSASASPYHLTNMATYFRAVLSE